MSDPQFRGTVEEPEQHSVATGQNKGNVGVYDRGQSQGQSQSQMMTIVGIVVAVLVVLLLLWWVF
jgi:cobalamin biosynthesis Mg chelatase CobN